MTILDAVALGSAIVTGLTVFARAELLQPRVKSAYASNVLVRLLMDATALAAAFVAFEIGGGATLPDGVAGFMILCAVTSTVMLISMFVHDGRIVVAEVRAADVQDMRAAVEAAVPPAVDAGIPQVFKDLAASPDPYTPGKSD